MKPPVLLLHSFFGTPELMAPWAEQLRAHGYETTAATLPGRNPTDTAVLDRSGFADYLDAAMAAYDAIGSDAIVIGHSLGGLLGQHIAARRNPTALVLLASVPPGTLWAQPGSMPYLVPILPAIIAGRAFRPSSRTMANVPLNTLGEQERQELIPRLVPDSGRIFRQMSLGVPALRVNAADVSCPVLCVSGGADRNVSSGISRRLARRYGAEHQVHPSAPHWIVAESLVPQVAPPVLGWLAAATR